MDGGGEVGEVRSEEGGDFRCGPILWEGRVGGAEVGVGGGRKAAASAVGIEMLAASGVIDGVGVSGLLGHE